MLFRSAGAQAGLEAFGEGGVEVPLVSLEFVQESHCHVAEWTALEKGVMSRCVVPTQPPPPAAVSPPPLESSSSSANADNITNAAAQQSGEDAMPLGATVTTVEHNHHAGDFVDEDMSGEDAGEAASGGEATATAAATATTTTPMRVNPDFDGAFLSMRIGGFGSGLSGAMGAKSNLANNYLILQGRVVLIGFSLQADISVIPGKMEDGGGIYASLFFEWSLGSLKLCEIEASLEFVPLDVENMLGFSILAELWKIKISLSVTITPHVLNIIIVPIEVTLKVAISAVVVPILLALVVAWAVLEALRVVLEAALRLLATCRN